MQYHKRLLTGKRSFTIYDLTFMHVAMMFTTMNKAVVVCITVFSRLINQKVHSSSTYNTQ